MSIYLRWGGAILLMLGALYFSRGYEKYLMRRVAEQDGLADLISHVGGMINRFLSSGEELWRDFHNDALEKCGLLPSLRGGMGLKDAFDKCGEKMSLSASAKEKISASLGALGRDYREGEVRLLAELEKQLRSDSEAERSAVEKNIKVARALLLGGALAAVIMLM